jgi:hypothetical protein
MDEVRMENMEKEEGCCIRAKLARNRSADAKAMRLPRNLGRTFWIFNWDELGRSGDHVGQYVISFKSQLSQRNNYNFGVENFMAISVHFFLNALKILQNYLL